MSTFTGWWGNFVSSKDIVQILILSACKSIVLISAIILLKVSLEPLAELKVVEISCLCELAHFDMPFDSILVKGVLEYFVILNILVLVFGSPLDLAEWKRAWEESV